MREWLKGRLRDYFTGRGCEEVVANGIVDMAFRDGRNLIGVQILEVEEGAGVIAAKSIRECIYSLLRKAGGRFDKLYIAAPELGVRTLPLPSEFRSSGVGLLMVGEEGVKEAVLAAPLPREDASVRYEEVAKRLDGLEKSLRAMEARIELLEARLKELEADLAGLRSGAVPHGREPAPTTMSTAVVRREEAASEIGEMPDFVRDNPWIEQLRRRASRE